jgi:rifampicin phosphotransferase
VLDLNDGVRAPRDQTGGKASGLSRVLSLGFDVPAGFVVTTQAYHDWVREHGSDAIDAAYAHLQLGPEPLVAVRSSAIGEDGAESSFAGQQETFLSVPGRDEVRRRIVGCWARNCARRRPRSGSGSGESSPVCARPG